MYTNRDFEELLNFEYNLNHKVSGMVAPDEIHEMFYEGFITKLFEPEYPKTIGSFELIVYDLEKAREFDNFDELMEMFRDISEDMETRYGNIQKLIDDYDVDFKSKDKILFLKNVILQPEFRGRGVLNELMKSIYLTHFSKNSLLILNSAPIQNNEEELNFHFEEFPIKVMDGYDNDIEVMSGDYFELNKLPEQDEGNDYKLYAKMLKLYLKQFEKSNYFYQDNNEDFSKIFKIEKKVLNL